MNRINIYTFFLLFLLAFSCEKIRYTDFPAHEPVLTVNSIFGTDSLASLQLFASKGLEEGPFFEAIEGATVEVWENGEPAGPLYMQKPGYYQSDTLYPDAGKTYTLRVSAAGFPTAEAFTTLPPKPLIEDIWVTSSPASSDEEPLRRLHITINDATGADFYLLDIYRIDSAFTYDSPKPSFRRSLSTYFQEPVDEISTPFGEGFTDITFEGKPYELVVDYPHYNNATVYFQLSRANEELYRYFKTYSQHSNYEEQLFSEPQEVYLNIEGGYGIFGSYTELTYRYGK